MLLTHIPLCLRPPFMQRGLQPLKVAQPTYAFVSMDLCISQLAIITHLFLFISISVNFSTHSCLLMVFVPLLPSLSPSNLFSLIIPLHLHISFTSPDHLRALLVLLTRAVLARSLAITDGRACKVVMVILVQ